MAARYDVVHDGTTKHPGKRYAGAGQKLSREGHKGKEVRSSVDKFKGSASELDSIENALSRCPVVRKEINEEE